MIKNVEQLNSLRAVKQQEMALRQPKNIDRAPVPDEMGGRMQILVCGVAGCHSSGSLKVYEVLKKSIEDNHMEDEIKLISTGCMGLCAQGPLMVVYPGRTMYTRVKPEDVEEIFESHIKGGKPVERLFAVEEDGRKIEDALGHHSFYSKQMKIALKNCGSIDPHDIDEFIGVDG